MKQISILSISGSLKSASANTTILRELAGFQNENIHYQIFNGLDELPHFNPDKEEGSAAVKHFKRYLKEADGVIISTPEYAFGVPGVLKNALDWTVSSGELNEKPVIAISASPLYEGGSKAMASLLLTLSALGVNMDQGSSLSIANIANKITRDKISDEQTRQDLKNLLNHLIHVIHQNLKDKSNFF